MHKEEKMKINAFINCYSMSKTLRFKLAPEYETEKNLLEKEFLDRDKLRADDYDLMKKVIDKYHKHFIDKALEEFRFDLLQEYAEAFYSQSADDDGKKLEEIKKKMCKELATCFSKQDEFKLLDKKELVEKIIPAAEFIEDEEKDIAKRFKGFTTYFTGFNENRQNLYAAELKHGTIAFRLIEENLPAFLYNCKKGAKVFEGLDAGDAETLNNELGEILSIGNVKDILSVEYYNKTLTQNGIDVYNRIIGGYTQEDGTKIKGVNEYVNLYNQTHDKKLPSLAKLKKQILSDSYSLSFLPAKFNDDSELLLSLKKFYSMVNEETGLSVEKAIREMRDVFSHIDDCDLHNVFIDAKFINKVSNDVFGNWSVLIDGINAEYEKLNYDYYKIIIPEANGSGAIGEVVPTPIIGQPIIGQPTMGHTDTFLSIGKFNNRTDAMAVYKYILTKFTRALLGSLKVTQHNAKECWQNVPLQDFTDKSDIDWSKSVAEIDQQLYKKYNLTQEEIDFIEKSIKPME